MLSIYRRNRARAARRRGKPVPPRSLAIENLEQRQVLAILAPIPPGISLAFSVVNLIKDALPADIRDYVPAEIDTFLSANPTFVYQAFPQEVNDVSVTANAFNTFLLLDEGGNNVPVLRLPPAFQDDLLEDIDAGFSFVGEITVPLGKFLGLDLPDVEAIIPNPRALLDYLPIYDGVAAAIRGFLDFTFVPEIDFGPVVFPEIEFPELDLGLFTICDGGCTLIPEFTLIPHVTLLEAITVRDILPGDVVDVLESIADFFDDEAQQNGGALLSLLDGDDEADLSNLWGVSQVVFGGVGNDTIRWGGTDHPLEVLGGPRPPGYSPQKFYFDGDSGRDTFVINPRLNARNVEVIGGADDDRLLIEGRDSNDIIRITIGPNGQLLGVSFEEPNPGGATASEVQTIVMPSNVTGGTFTLAFLGVTTGPIAFNATAAEVAAALAALSTVGGAANISVTSGNAAGGPWVVAFQGALANQDVLDILPDGANLTLAGGDVIVAETTQGSATTGVNEVQRITLPPQTTGGTFAVSFGGNTASGIPAGANKDILQDALVAAGIAGGNIRVTGGIGGPWLVEFRDSEGAKDQPALAVDASGLTGGVSGNVAETTAAAAEVQQVSLPAGVTGGTFTLSFDAGGGADTTAPLPHNATAAQVQAALGGLTSIGAGNVSVTGSPGGPWNVSLSGAAAASANLIAGNAAALTGGNVVNALETIPRSGSNEVQQVSLSAATSGTFRLTFNNGAISRTTDPIPFDATPDEVRAALAALSSIGGTSNVMVSSANPAGGPWLVAFLGSLSSTNFPPMTVDTSGLNAGATGGVVTFNNGAAANQVQIVDLGGATAGQFRLQFGAQQTGPLNFNASAADVKAQLDTILPSAGTAVRGSSGGRFYIEFIGPFAGTVQPLVTFADVSLSGGAAPSVTETFGVGELQTIATTPPATSGTFTLTFNGETTGPIAFDATAATVRTALAALASIGTLDNVQVTSPSAAGGPWDVRFAGELSGANQPLIVGNGSNLAGAFAAAGSIGVVVASPGVNERQTISLPGATGGTFLASFGGQITAPITFNAGNLAATATNIQAALAALPSVGAGNVAVASLGGNQFRVEFQGSLSARNVTSIGLGTSLLTGNLTATVDEVIAGHGTNEVQTLTLPPGTTGGSFTVSFAGSATATVSFNASAAEVQTALESLGTIGVGNVAVTSNNATGGPWVVEFTAALGSANQPAIVANGASLTVTGGAIEVQETTPGANGQTKVLASTQFKTIDSVELFQIEGGGGDDRLIVEGAIQFAQGIYFDGGDGNDFLELISRATTPNFVLPIFPDDTQAVISMDARSFQFTGVEGGIILDAESRAAIATLSGTDDGNDIRFAGIGSQRATFARDAQVTTTLRGFGDGSTINLRGEQGDDTISVALNGVTEFATINVDGGGPAGADAIRFEGTDGNDAFTFQHAANSTEAGQTIVGSTTPATIDFVNFSEMSFVGLGGTDGITVNAPRAGNDYVLAFPALANNSSFVWTTLREDSDPPGPTPIRPDIVYPQVPLSSIENRTFNTGTGADTLALLSDDVPGVNSEATVVGGNSITSLFYFDHQVQFIHDVVAADAVVLEMGSAEDLIDVTPGVGIDVFVNTGVGNDFLTYNGLGGDVSVDAATATISQTGLGDVIYSGVDHVVLVDGASLSIAGGDDDDEFTYTPLSADAGRVLLAGAVTDFAFGEFAALLLIGNEAAADRVTVEGTNGRDQIVAGGGTRTVSVRNAAGALLLPVQLDTSIELAVFNGRDGDDTFLVLPEPLAGNAPLAFFVDGASPNGFDRLVVQDEGPGNVVRHHQSLDQQSGAIVVGLLPPIGYAGIERVDILPLDPVTGGTGADGMGRIVVFHSDELEQNDGRPNATEFGDLEQTSHKPNIDPGGETDPFGTGLDLPGDEDWYRFVATTTDTLRFGLVFEPIGTLSNGNPGLPGDGLLRIDAYDAAGNPIAKIPGEGAATHTIGVETGMAYFLRVRGQTPEAINVYDFTIEDLDNIGPQVTDVCITDNPATQRDECEYNLFAPKPETDGPTPLVDRLTISIRDLVERFPGFLYPALDVAIASTPGHYRVVGDANGIIPIRSITVVNDPVVVGQAATASIVLEFFTPLPDDRFTLFVSDSITDPTGVQLDGESNAAEPQPSPGFPSGDGVPGGDFVARFTVDSRPEIGVWSAGSVYIDTNGNNRWDPTNTDFTNRDITYVLGFTSDNLFAGNFSAISVPPPAPAPGDGGPQPAGGAPAPIVADGFDKLGGYGFAGGSYRWLIDITNDGVPDIVHTEPAAVNGVPVAGNFDGNLVNGDEVALFTGTKWHFDTNHDYRVDAQLATAMRGTPVVGDFNGDGFDDLATWSNDVFYIDLYNAALPGVLKWDGVADLSFGFGFPGILEKPVAADMNQDGFEDLGLWVPNRSGATPDTDGEWYFLISVDPDTDQHVSILDRIETDPTTQQPVVKFTPIPFGHDILAQFGDEFALPIVGNFDPPVAPSPIEPATVAEVAVRGSGWSSTAAASAGDTGAAGATGSASDAGGSLGVPLGMDGSTEHLALAGVDQFVARYAEDAEVRFDDLSIASTAGTPYQIDAFSYNPATRTATWTFDRPLDADRVLVSLANAGAVVWSKTLDVLAGDFDESGAVDAADVAAAVAAVYGGQTTHASAADLNRDGILNLRDVIALRNRLGTSLPAAPSAAAGAIVRAAAGNRVSAPREEVLIARRRTARTVAVDTAIAELGSPDTTDTLAVKARQRRVAVRHAAKI